MGKDVPTPGAFVCKESIKVNKHLISTTRMSYFGIFNVKFAAYAKLNHLVLIWNDSISSPK